MHTIKYIEVDTIIIFKNNTSYDVDHFYIATSIF